MFKSHQLYSNSSNITRKLLSNNNRSTTNNILGTINNPASSATQLQNNGISTNGNYYILIGGSPVEMYVDFTTFSGGPYVLIMRLSSSSSYNYDNAVWTNTSGGVNTALVPGTNSDQVSSAFYNLSSTRTGLALHSNSNSYFHYIDHSNLTARALANGSGGSLTATSPNGTTVAAGGQISDGQASRAQGWFAAVTASGGSSSNGSTYYRHGWKHRDPDPLDYGYCRFGWTADQDSSDSQDRGIGIGLKNNGGSPVGSFSTGSGYFDYSGGNKGSMNGFLYMKN
jgi:hypothetical protein